MTERSTIPSMSTLDTVRLATDVLIPNVAKGPIIRRPKMVAMAERLNLDTRSVKRMQALRKKYGPDPVRLKMPIISRAIVFESAHVQRVLNHAPEPFSPASDEKRAALAHFEPKTSLISRGPKRTDRRQFNERVLQADNPIHQLAERFVDVVNDEATRMFTTVDRTGELTWDEFFDTWYKVVRRVVFGDFARDDHDLTDLLADLRSKGNWAMFTPKRKERRARFLKRISDSLAKAEPGSLGSFAAAVPQTDDTAPAHQIPQWLFAFDPAGMTTFRALALLATHPDRADEARQEIAADTSGRQHLPFLRGCILESLRLWPTTPLLLRQSTEESDWDTGVMPAKTGLLIYAPFFHRDTERLEFADRFAPDIWSDGRTADDRGFFPFSDGPAICPGRHVVLLMTSAMLAVIIERHDVQLKPPRRLDPSKPLPGTLNNYALRFTISPRGEGAPS